MLQCPPRSVLLLPLLFAACPAPEPESTGPDVDYEHETWTPLNLEVSVTVLGADPQNPHGDGSGDILIQATATDAVRYEARIQGRPPVGSGSGEIPVTVVEPGTVTYTVEVVAFAVGGGSESVTEEVTVYREAGPFPSLIWSDEFDGSGYPDADKWHPQVIPPDNGGWFNNEQQHYTDRLENAYVSDGTLKIVARKERYTTQGSTRPYTSARLNSTFPFTYGRVEVRAKLPPQRGTWPAIWTLGANINEVGNPFGTTYGNVGWPACGEIDIMEQRGWDKDTTIAYFHWGDTRTGEYQSEGGDLRVPAATTDFHVYALEWTERSLIVFVDDEVVYQLPNDVGRPYDNPHYLLLNIAMGGNLGGDIPGDFNEAVLEIDYVRVYQ